MLSEETRRYFLSRVEWDWRRLSRDERGNTWGVWLREYAPVPDTLQDLCELGPEAVPVRAWFLDGAGLREMSPWSYVRMVTVHGGRHWYTGTLCAPASTGGFGGARRYSIGHTAMAPYAGCRAVYIEEVWGGLFGRGYRYDLDEQGRPCGGTSLWIS